MPFVPFRGLSRILAIAMCFYVFIISGAESPAFLARFFPFSLSSFLRLPPPPARPLSSRSNRFVFVLCLLPFGTFFAPFLIFLVKLFAMWYVGRLQLPRKRAKNQSVRGICPSEHYPRL